MTVRAERNAWKWLASRNLLNFLAVYYVKEMNSSIFSRWTKKKIVNRTESQPSAFLAVSEVLMPHRFIKIRQIPNNHHSWFISSRHNIPLRHAEPANSKCRFYRTIFKNDLCSIGLINSPLNKISNNQLPISTARSNHCIVTINTHLGASEIRVVVGWSQFDLLTADIQKTNTGVITWENNQFRVRTKANVCNANALWTNLKFLDDYPI